MRPLHRAAAPPPGDQPSEADMIANGLAGRAERIMECDQERRRVRQELVSLLTALAAEVQLLTAAVLRSDLAALASRFDAVAEMAADPALNLGQMTVVYSALRGAIADGQPGPDVP